MAFLLNSQAQGVSGKNEQSAQTLGRGPMQQRGLKAGLATATWKTGNPGVRWGGTHSYTL